MNTEISSPAVTEPSIDDERLKGFFPSMSDQDLLSRVEAMRRQEEGVYHCSKHCFPSRTPQDSSACCSDLRPIDEECRSKMVDWTYQLIDFCKLGRECVSVATSHLDRFLHTEQGGKSLHDRDEFQLAAIAAIYLSVKSSEPQHLSSKQMSAVSHGHHSSDDVEEMELSMLGALQWRVNPPTALSFVHHFLALVLSEDIDKSFGQDLLTCSKLQVEHAVRDYYFVDVKPSLIAYAAVLNALSSHGVANLSSSALVVDAFRKFENIRSLASSPKELRRVRERLLQTLFNYAGAEELPRTELQLSHSTPTPGSQKGDLDSGNQSPRCISTHKSTEPFSVEPFLCGLFDVLAFMQQQDAFSLMF